MSKPSPRSRPGSAPQKKTPPTSTPKSAESSATSRTSESLAGIHPERRRRATPSRKFAVARLPATLRAQVEEQLRDGLPYSKIVGFVRSKGHSITKSALSGWWSLHQAMGRELGAARHIEGVAEAVARKLTQPNSDLLPVLRELLATELYRRRGELLQLPVQDLIFELRQLERLKPSAPKLSAEQVAEAIAARLGSTGEKNHEEES